jgi:hypothetical protein
MLAWRTNLLLVLIVTAALAAFGLVAVEGLHAYGWSWDELGGASAGA